MEVVGHAPKSQKKRIKVLTKSNNSVIILLRSIIRKNTRGDTMKVGITLDDELLKRIDDFADKNYMSRSGLLSLAATSYINAAEVSSAIKDISLAMRKIADTGNVDHETMEKLEDFERLAKFITPVK
ncbi:MAG: type II toxin-antitoxin system HicB family antitoxin [Paludibacteraceae bacterium]|nr:type II toxin-antitoxin system HicB family antitoxin [Paludibacteraceae bacterium]